MNLTIEQWKEILNAVNANEGDILGQIKVKLLERYGDIHKGWEQKSFDVNHIFNVSMTIFGDQFVQEAALLHIAAYSNRKDLVTTLLKNQAKVDAKGNNGFTALHSAILGKNTEIAEWLIKNGANVKEKFDLKFPGGGFTGITALHSAIFDKNTEIAEFLIRNGAKVNEKFDLKSPEGEFIGITALHSAIFDNNTEIAEFLIRNGANVNEKFDLKCPKGEFTGITALHSAIFDKNTEIAEFLIRNGANVNEKFDLKCPKGEFTGITTLPLAIFNNDTEIAEFLIKNGANVDEKFDLKCPKGEFTGITALHLAAQDGELGIVKYLVDKKADVNLKNNDGFTALDFAEQSDKKYIVRYLHLCKGKKMFNQKPGEYLEHSLTKAGRDKEITSKAVKVGCVCGVIAALAVGGGLFAAGIELPILALIGIAVAAALVIGVIAGGITYSVSKKLDEPDLGDNQHERTC
ncbi:hypothetical protein JTE90_027151 [Oedothorax gibbosus]|uniref:Uncharacterized protein n=1 Tax=Oedothorax gibbosus TaxID=931172 RepID=A0AAV6TSZ2_9ARAC|nr:hypothetical protein JTE90_027151 [Oedothorax gibbosus]